MTGDHRCFALVELTVATLITAMALGSLASLYHLHLDHVTWIEDRSRYEGVFLNLQGGAEEGVLVIVSGFPRDGTVKAFDLLTVVDAPDGTLTAVVDEVAGGSDECGR